MARAYLGLGSNLGDRRGLLCEAIARLGADPDVRVVAVSPLYETEPWEQEPGAAADRQGWYLNCAVAIETRLEPEVLLDRMQAVEASLGRARRAGPSGTPGPEPRPIDIDLLLYEARVVSLPDRLQVPHLLLHQRAFALRPLADLAPDARHAALDRTIRELLDELEDRHETGLVDASPWWTRA